MAHTLKIAGREYKSISDVEDDYVSIEEDIKYHKKELSYRNALKRDMESFFKDIGRTPDIEAAKKRLGEGSKKRQKKEKETVDRGE